MTTNNKTLPSHELFSVCKRDDGKASWTKIGVAFAHKDGNGYAFKMTAIPAPGGDFVMRRLKPKSSSAA